MPTGWLGEAEGKHQAIHNVTVSTFRLEGLATARYCRCGHLATGVKLLDGAKPLDGVKPLTVNDDDKSES